MNPFITALLVATLWVAIPPTAQGAPCSSGSSSSTSASSGGNGFTISSTSANASSCDAISSTSGVAGTWHSDYVCEFGGSATCVELTTCAADVPVQYVYFVTDGGQELPGQFVCPQDAVALPEVTAGMVLAALRRVPLPASELVVQPPNGRTLVNFATNFYTDTQELTRTITLLGQRVDLRITPASYGWRFGDGESASTTTPGAAYPDLQVTHDYLSAGGVAPAVDTTYTADFRVNAGPWRPVPGTVTIPGATVPLEVVEATPTLVGYR